MPPECNSRYLAFGLSNEVSSFWPVGEKTLTLAIRVDTSYLACILSLMKHFQMTQRSMPL